MIHRNSFFQDAAEFDYANMIAFLNSLPELNSAVKFEYLGTSILGKGIPIISIGEGLRSFLYVGAHHGMEWITSLILCRFLEEFSCFYREHRSPYGLSLDALTKICRLYIVPMLNPDGVEYQMHGIADDNPLYDRAFSMNGRSLDFSRWQANARGVDLNHNYDAGFDEYKKLEIENGIDGGGPTRYSGEYPESEPEVAALCKFIRFHDDIQGIMTLHTQGEEIFFRSGGITLPKSERVVKKMATLCGYTPSDAEGLASYGGLTDWCVRSMQIPSFTLECGRGCNPLPASVYPSIYDCLRKLLFLFPTLF